MGETLTVSIQPAGQIVLDSPTYSTPRNPIMKTPVSDIAFTPSVKTQQELKGSRKGYEKMEETGGWRDQVDADLKAFLAERDSFYLGTASADGRPYIQHRGGPKGFLKILDASTLAFVDYAGNRQYISMGNLSENNQAYIFLMDYPNRRRIKIWGRAEIIENDPELLKRLLDDDYKARPERVFVFHIEAWDTNCPQHIQPRFTHEEIAPAIEKLEQRIAELEEELAALKSANTTPVV
ncbi:MAG: putative pyridoxine 5'-phosphate oxidase superfamily flavin-nucleotide-binding protein [Candidatus Latescibacterota bacterium]|jgi:predicted pyridoxine 5'-phosphate oxidase superfamily flavin-nucleotide-binding protein